MTPPWSLHPQLEHDTMALGDLPLSRLLLHNDANYPWLLLVPRRVGASEIIDLDEADQAQLLSEIARAVACAQRGDGLPQAQHRGDRQCGAATPCSCRGATAR